jgi:hypothetical protein
MWSVTKSSVVPLVALTSVLPSAPTRTNANTSRTRGKLALNATR